MSSKPATASELVSDQARSTQESKNEKKQPGIFLLMLQLILSLRTLPFKNKKTGSKNEKKMFLLVFQNLPNLQAKICRRLVISFRLTSPGITYYPCRGFWAYSRLGRGKKSDWKNTQNFEEKLINQHRTRYLSSYKHELPRRSICRSFELISSISLNQNFDSFPDTFLKTD